MSKKICKIVSKLEVPACCNLFIYPQLAFNASQIWRDKSQIGSSVPPSAVAISSKHSASASVRVFSYVIFDCLQLSVLCCAVLVIHELFTSHIYFGLALTGSGCSCSRCRVLHAEWVAQLFVPHFKQPIVISIQKHTLTHTHSKTQTKWSLQFTFMLICDANLQQVNGKGSEMWMHQLVIELLRAAGQLILHFPSLYVSLPPDQELRLSQKSTKP